jgi:putative nucleotidyltransferase with HDIG domain
MRRWWGNWSDTCRGPADATRVNALIILVASAASALSVAVVDGVWQVGAERPGELLVFAVLAVALQLAAVEIYGRGSLSFSGMGILATGFALGVAPGMLAALLVAVFNFFVQQSRVDRAAFNAANLSLSAAAAVGAYQILGGPDWTTAAQVVPALIAGIIFMVVNVGLLSLAMSLAEGLPIESVWRERFRWSTPYYLVSGPLALATTVAFEEAGLVGMLAFGLPPALIMFSIRQYVARTRDSVEEVRRANEELRVANSDLARMIQHVQKQHLATIAALSRSIEAKDGSTGEHTERVAELAVELARGVGYSGADLDAIQIGALLHDIGKIGVPEAILNKPGPLTDEEWEIMKRHPLVSEHILSGIGLSPIVLEIARWSHERFDGKGYPDGLAGHEIPLSARIVLVADAFDAITSDRPYRRGRSVVDALGELHLNAGTQFCPEIVVALEKLYAEQPQLLGAGRLRAVERVA